ncbi:hypothetical protein HUJ04_000172 [Dendroctonus ponderosae]|nr:hypothetical protein HUJ04_000172 [Dendroctonus ponderosae]
MTHADGNVKPFDTKCQCQTGGVRGVWTGELKRAAPDMQFIPQGRHVAARQWRTPREKRNELLTHQPMSCDTQHTNTVSVTDCIHGIAPDPMNDAQQAPKRQKGGRGPTHRSASNRFQWHLFAKVNNRAHRGQGLCAPSGNSAPPQPRSHRRNAPDCQSRRRQRLNLASIAVPKRGARDVTPPPPFLLRAVAKRAASRSRQGHVWNPPEPGLVATRPPTNSDEFSGDAAPILAPKRASFPPFLGNFRVWGAATGADRFGRAKNSRLAEAKAGRATDFGTIPSGATHKPNSANIPMTVTADSTLAPVQKPQSKRVVNVINANQLPTGASTVTPPMTMTQM